ncbi:MAG: 50S ribosomal protein L25 [Actinobacteria bacterium]|nr:50S ribosomal protein L25 [Actinomycetota bacterium]MDA2960724.1 50S ribosomal protein L25 [Actinomycetota bacterium]MDA2994415.1 50S ribosomal protein L25 [Actinomycetota bacterium]
MSDSVLIAEAGRTTGSAESRRIRREDRIPAVVYGKGMEPISISVNRRDLRVALSGTAGMNTILDLTVDGTAYPSIVKDMQRHPVRRTVAHVDFIQIDLSEEITVSVPVRLEGEAKQVAMNNGLVDQQMMEIQIRTTPRSIPDELVIDISDMTVNTVITVADVPLPNGVVAVSAEDQTVVTAVTLRVATDEPVAGDSEGEEGAAEASEESSDGGSDDSGDSDSD